MWDFCLFSSQIFMKCYTVAFSHVMFCEWETLFMYIFMKCYSMVNGHTVMWCLNEKHLFRFSWNVMPWPAIMKCCFEWETLLSRFSFTMLYYGHASCDVFWKHCLFELVWSVISASNTEWWMCLSKLCDDCWSYALFVLRNMIICENLCILLLLACSRFIKNNVSLWSYFWKTIKTAGMVCDINYNYLILMSYESCFFLNKSHCQKKSEKRIVFPKFLFWI